MEENNKELKAYFNGFINCLLVIGRFAVVLFCVLICQVVNAQVELGHQKKYYVDFPYNIQTSELDINCKISQVEYTYYSLEYKSGEFQPGRQFCSAIYQYNTNGQLIRYYEESSGTVDYNWQLKYDANGKIVYPNNYFYENGKLSKVIWDECVIRMYYTNGILNKIVYYDESDEGEIYTVYFQNGDAIKVVTPPGLLTNNKVETTTYSYNNHKLTKGDGPDFTFTYTYNAKDLVSRAVSRYNMVVYQDNSIYDYTYEYDSKGNWIKRTCSKKDENGYIKKGTLTVREITYSSGSSNAQQTESKTGDSKTYHTEAKNTHDQKNLSQPEKNTYLQGVCYLMYRNYDEAFKLLLIVANQNNIDAQRLVGYCYRHGYGVKRNLEQSKKWYKKAADAGDDYAIECYQQLLEDERYGTFYEGPDYVPSEQIDCNCNL